MELRIFALIARPSRRKYISYLWNVRILFLVNCHSIDICCEFFYLLLVYFNRDSILLEKFSCCEFLLKLFWKAHSPSSRNFHQISCVDSPDWGSHLTTPDENQSSYSIRTLGVMFVFCIWSDCFKGKWRECSGPYRTPGNY